MKSALKHRSVNSETLRKGICCAVEHERQWSGAGTSTQHFRGGQVLRVVVVPSVSTNQVFPHLKPPLMLLGVTAALDWRGAGVEKGARHYCTLFRVL